MPDWVFSPLTAMVIFLASVAAIAWLLVASLPDDFQPQQYGDQIYIPPESYTVPFQR